MPGVNCTYKLTLVTDKEKGGVESYNYGSIEELNTDLKKFIKSNKEISGYYESSGDYRFSKNIVEDNVSLIEEINSKNKEALRKLKPVSEIIGDEDTGESYKDGYIPVEDFVLDQLSKPTEKYNEQAWENKYREELAKQYANLSEEERKATIDELVNKKKKFNENMRKLGKGIHQIVYYCFYTPYTSRNKSTEVDQIRENVRNLNSKAISIDELSSEDIQQIINQVYKIKKELIPKGRKCKKMFIEPCIAYDSNTFKVRGKIDILLVHEDNSIDIIDIKTSSKFYDNWDVNKKSNAADQLRVYSALLEANGITSDKIRLHILPINVNHDQGKFGISSVGYNNTTTQVPVDSFKVSKINELLGIDPAKKFTSTPVTDNVITTLTGMFGYDAYNYEIESANLKAEFARRVTKLPNGNYKFYDAFNKKEVIKSTEEEIKKELSIYLSNLNDSRVEQVQKIKEEFLKIKNYTKLSSLDVRQRRLFNFFGGTSEASVRLNEWLRLKLHKYQSDINWRVIDNDDLANLGILMFQNDVTKEVEFVSFLFNDINAQLNLEKGTNILGKYYDDSTVESLDNKLQATIGNMELIKLMLISNLYKSGYSVSKLEVLDLHNRTDNNDLGVRRKKLEYNYNILANKSGVEVNTTKSTDYYDRIYNMYKSIVDATDIDSYDLSSKQVAELKMEVSPFDTLEKLKILNEIKTSLDQTTFRNRKPTDENTAISRFYLEVVKAITFINGLDVDYINDPNMSGDLLGGNILSAVQNGTLFNSTLFNTTDTIPVISAIATRIFQGQSQLRSRYSAYKTVDRRFTDKFYEDQNKGFVTNRIMNRYDISFENLFDNSDNGKKKLLLKDYRTDTSLNKAEKEYLKWWLEDLNKVRYKGKSIDEVGEMWFSVPLLDAKLAFRIKQGQKVSKAVKDTVALEDVDPRKMQGFSSDVDKSKNEYLFEAMYNGFKQSEDESTRLDMIKSKGLETFERNLERIKDTYIHSNLREEIFSPIVRDISSAITAYAAMTKMSSKYGSNEATIKYIVDAIKSNVLDESIVDEDSRDLYRIIGTAKSASSLIILGFNTMSGIKETGVGLWTLYSNAIANSQDETRFGVSDLNKAYKMIWKDSVHQLSTITMGEYLNFTYGLANMSDQEIVERQNYNKGELGRFEDRAYFFCRAPDFLHRMTILYSYMIKHGSLDAHKVFEDHVEYDWTKDKRFSLYAKDKTGRTIPESMKTKWAEQRALYNAMKEQMIKEGAQIIDWKTGYSRAMTEEDELPKAYTDIEMERITQEANTLFGYMDSTNKSMFFRKGIGVVIGQFKTFFSAKKNQWFLSRGVYKNGSWKHVSDLEGNKLYFKILESGEKVMTTEVTDMPVVKWEGSMMEGIFWSLRDLIMDIVKMDKEKFHKDWSDPIKRRNLILALNDLLGTGLFMFFSWLLNELYENRKDKSPMTAALFKTGSRLSKNIGVDLNIVNTFWQQSEFNIPILTLMKNAGNGMLEFITSGDVDLMKGFIRTFGVFSIAREPIIELIDQTK